MPRSKQIMTESEINLFAEGLKRLARQGDAQARKIASLEAEVATLRKARTPHATASRGAGRAAPSKRGRGGRSAWGTLLTSALANKVLSAVQSSKEGLSTIELGKKLKQPTLAVKRIAHGFKRKGTFKVKGVRRSARYQFAG